MIMKDELRYYDIDATGRVAVEYLYYGVRVYQYDVLRVESARSFRFRL